jgi:hypothetical protein
MGTNITKDELRLLACLHEHAKGYGDAFTLDKAELLRVLGVDEPTLLRSVSFLMPFGLIGAKITTLGHGAETASLLRWVWLTAAGENFMRELEAQPAFAQRITMKTAAAFWDTGRAIIVKVLSDFLAGKL